MRILLNVRRLPLRRRLRAHTGLENSVLGADVEVLARGEARRHDRGRLDAVRLAFSSSRRSCEPS